MEAYEGPRYGVIFTLQSSARLLVTNHKDLQNRQRIVLYAPTHSAIDKCCTSPISKKPARISWDELASRMTTINTTHLTHQHATTQAENRAFNTSKTNNVKNEILRVHQQELNVVKLTRSCRLPLERSSSRLAIQPGRSSC